MRYTQWVLNMNQMLLPDSKLVDQAKTFEFFATFAAVVIALSFFNLKGIAWMVTTSIDAIVHRDASLFWPEAAPVLKGLANILPSVLYLMGLWTARGMFGRIAKGEVFSLRNSRSIAGIGENVVWGAAAAILISPTLIAWIEGEGFDFHLNTESVVILVVGGAILLLGRIMARAQAETAALKSELEDFI